jgi:hypothetical protein
MNQMEKRETKQIPVRTILLIIVGVIVLLIVLARIFQPIISKLAFSASVPADLLDEIDSEVDEYCIRAGASAGCFPNHAIESAQKATTLTDSDLSSGITEIWCINSIYAYKGMMYWGDSFLYAKGSDGTWNRYYSEVDEEHGENGYVMRGCSNFHDK